jgi:hypothetical protein
MSTVMIGVVAKLQSVGAALATDAIKRGQNGKDHDGERYEYYEEGL